MESYQFVKFLFLSKLNTHRSNWPQGNKSNYSQAITLDADAETLSSRVYC